MKHKQMATYDNNRNSSLKTVGSWIVAGMLFLFIGSAESVVDVALTWMGL